MYGNLLTPAPVDDNDMIEDMSYAMILEAGHREAERMGGVMFGPPELHVMDEGTEGEMRFLVWGMVSNG